ncbi:hypothetical protein Golax_023384 [Gossypium laxum]|uniref:Uncharacterized protein n=1 Tax=Gossypium laxum TaxID=34288 RepID=A0A7J9B053_9ROSI|nr:hypothetical protein [Gossypium laxum]
MIVIQLDQVFFSLREFNIIYLKKKGGSYGTFLERIIKQRIF